MERLVTLAAVAILGFVIAKADDHIRRVAWGWVWELTPVPDFPSELPVDQLVHCPDGKLTLPPWHVRVIYNEDAPFSGFMQERGH